ncbi:MAG: mandelate racemase/muconate lactonizing enzyme family protein, partial [Bacillota bacterium]
MKIKSVETINVRIPLNDPKTFSTKKIYYRDYTIFIITTHCGLQGWSFSWGLPAVKTFIDQYTDLIVGEPAYAAEKIWDKVFRQVDRWDRSGVVMRALAGIDMALWDIIGKAANMPIYQLLGAAREEVEAYHSGGYYPQSCEGSTEATIDYVVNEMGRACEKGFRSFKMKIGAASPAVDLERVKQVRNAIGPDCKLMVDANCGYEPEVIIPLAQKMEQYDLTWIEEPVALDDLRKCARVAQSTSIPVAM